MFECVFLLALDTVTRVLLSTFSGDWVHLQKMLGHVGHAAAHHCAFCHMPTRSIPRVQGQRYTGYTGPLSLTREEAARINVIKEVRNKNLRAHKMCMSHAHATCTWGHCRYRNVWVQVASE